ncbi:MAG TPA: hypothetical protein VNI83_01770 [Vicinamibacterales bacterium]|nr:hypothetical protein [Vicinamibacterales bacterium]
MTLEELKVAWQRRPAGPPGATEEGPMKDIVDRLARLRREIRRRDAREWAAALVLVVAFGGGLVLAPTPLARAGAAVMAAAALLVIGVLAAIRVQYPRPPADAPLADFCRRELAHVDAQIRWMRRVAWWYLAPLLVGMNVFVWATSRTPAAAAVYLAGSLGLAAAVYRLNQRVVERELVPLRRDLERIVRDLSSGA